MSDKLANLTTEMINEDRKKFPRVFSMTTNERLSRILIWGGGTAFIFFALNKFFLNINIIFDYFTIVFNIYI